MATCIQRDKSQTTSLDQVELSVMKEYGVKLPIVKNLCSYSTDSLWMCSTSHLTAFDSTMSLEKVQPKTKLDILYSFDMVSKVLDMAVMPNNDLLLATCKEGLKQIKNEYKKVADSKYCVQSFDIVSVHVTKDIQVIVGCKNGRGHVAVVVMDSDGKHIKMFEKDENGQPKFTYPGRITSTLNGNIFVIDFLGADCKGRVLMLNQRGDIICKYQGHHEMNTKEHPFSPRSCVVTPLDNVIITDVMSSYLHILDNTGNLLTIYNTRDIGIEYPTSLAITMVGKSLKLYIGCSKLSRSRANGKLFKLKISEC